MPPTLSHELRTEWHGAAATIKELQDHPTWPLRHAAISSLHDDLAVVLPANGQLGVDCQAALDAMGQQQTGCNVTAGL